MRYLLDTHSLLWFLLNDSRLSRAAHAQMSDPDNELFVSIASLWEISIKSSTGKMTLQQPFTTMFPQQLRENNMTLLPISVSHLAEVAQLPFHRDPFDRLLTAQSLVEKLPIIGVDSAFDAYGVARLW